MNKARFQVLRPYLYHLTAAANLPRLRALRRFECANRLIARAGRPELHRMRRHSHVPIVVDGQEILLRDQKPLHRGPIELLDGWSYEDLVERLNGLVFFWPGFRDRPVPHGSRHFDRYRHEAPVVLRIPTADMFGHNESPRFSRYNSGAPRCSRGVHSPRGEKTFVEAEAFDLAPGSVVEVVFQQTAVIPSSAEVADLSAFGSWSPFYS